MPKYRLLTFEELKALEKDFTEFLAANSLPADDWVRIKKEDPSAAKKMIELFSDVVFEGVVRKVKFLDHRTPDRLTCFQCLENEMLLISFAVKGAENIDLSDATQIKSLTKSEIEKGELISTKKEYSEERGLEIFDLIQKGCEISDGVLYKTLWMLKTESEIPKQ